MFCFMCPSDQYLILARGPITHIASLKSHQHSGREHAWGLEQLLFVFSWGKKKFINSLAKWRHFQFCAHHLCPQGERTPSADWLMLLWAWAFKPFSFWVKGMLSFTGNNARMQCSPGLLHLEHFICWEEAIGEPSKLFILLEGKTLKVCSHFWQTSQSKHLRCCIQMSSHWIQTFWDEWIHQL